MTGARGEGELIIAEPRIVYGHTPPPIPPLLLPLLRGYNVAYEN